MAWGLDLTELRQLAKNALLYSSMSEQEKQVGSPKGSSNVVVFFFVFHITLRLLPKFLSL